MANDVHISGSGRVASGNYNEIHISGSGRLDGPVWCQSCHVSGSCRDEGTLTVMDDFHCSGSFRSEGHVDCGEISVSGSAHINGNVAGREEIHISGSLKCHSLYGGEVSISGGLNAERDVEAEEFHMSGGGEIKGLLNAEEVDICIGGITLGTALKIGQIGGSEIRIRRSKVGGLLGKLMGEKRLGSGIVEVGTIEGDDISLEAVKADVVRGSDVEIGEDCEIRRVEFSGELTVGTGAVVLEQVRI